MCDRPGGPRHGEADHHLVLMPRAHGTRGRFRNDHCRCEPCRRANAEYEAFRAASFDSWLPKISPVEDWMEDGECRKRGMTPDEFYPEGGDPIGRDAARAVCAACPAVVRRSCLEFALDNRLDWGIWGGTTGKDREDIRRNRRNGKRKVTV
jgi:WhiB family redox-sensing transcriptional regulator